MNEYLYPYNFFSWNFQKLKSFRRPLIALWQQKQKFENILILEESLEGGPEDGPNFADILNKALPDSDHSSCDSQSDRSSNSGEVSHS